MSEKTSADIIAEIRAHRAEYRQGQRRQDEQSLELRTNMTGMAQSIRDLERDMSAVKVRLETQHRMNDRLYVIERRQSWLLGAAAMLGAVSSWVSRKLF